MKQLLSLKEIEGEQLSVEQKSWLNGLVSGLADRGFKFTDVEPSPQPASTPDLDSLILEERVKRELHPLDAYHQLLEHAEANKAPDKETLFRFKWHGLFFLTPAKEAYMARLRIPGGQLKTFQVRELASIAKDLTTGYVQVTTRSNLQLRLIQPRDTPEFLRRVQSVGLHTRGSGADNIRNITCNPTAGIDPHELIDTLPLSHQLGQMILNDRAFYDLPRKFNIAFDGGGLIGSVEDTNDIGARAVRVTDAQGNPTVQFRIALGGATGHKAFANDLGVTVPPAKLLSVIKALVQVYIANGNRTDRKKARLKHLLESWSLERYLAETEKLLGWSLDRSPAPPIPPAQPVPHSHVGIFPQKQPGLNYIGIALPVGQITPKQMIRLAEIADLYGSGELRLTVWQNIILPNVPDAYVESAKKAIVKMGLDWKQSNLRSGIIACTGNSYCKFASANTKGHALELSHYLDKKLSLDQPINIHLTGCPNSCAQHYIGDIGLLGTKVKVSGESVEGYHVFVGGGFGEKRAIGRQVFQGISFDQLKPTLEKMLKAYLKHREGGESFQSFSTRHDLNKLQQLFCED
ncbi:MAG: NirA family protein [Verrucomicrobiota bacterium]|nr:NirA family protein [Verrucomicrobiota bacterium]